MSRPRCEVCGWDGTAYAGRDDWDALTTEHPREGDDQCVGPELVWLRHVAERARALLALMDAHDIPEGMELAREAFHELSDAVDALPTLGDQPAPGAPDVV